MFRNFKTVPYVIFGRGAFNQLGAILSEKRQVPEDFMVFLVDNAFAEKDLRNRIPARPEDLTLWVDVNDEPKTAYVDQLTARVRDFSSVLPEGIIGIGGGSTMDLAKAVSLMLTNPGSSTDYQGWDLVRHPGVYHVGIPTLSGTGAEASRTTVLCGPDKKLGINSDYTPFDQIVLDPELVSGAPANQRFFTGMDCYIHCVESLSGSFLNAFSRSYGEKAMDLCREVFLDGGPEADDKLMVASYFGGMSIAYSQVGICHALSYGLSFVLGVHHGIGNCLAFDRLDEYYPDGVEEFRRMVTVHNIELPWHRLPAVSEQEIEKMVDVALILEPLWENALGTDWKTIMTRQKIRDLYAGILTEAHRK
jgi:3-deoxy-alpha-D-manno-octulosonate 8-oxidase